MPYSIFLLPKIRRLKKRSKLSRVLPSSMDAEDGGKMFVHKKKRPDNVKNVKTDNEKGDDIKYPHPLPVLLK
ncbi:MAG: hypothetical protein ACPGJV_14045 [Bacteriovoracaceae bacterium]